MKKASLILLLLLMVAIGCAARPKPPSECPWCGSPFIYCVSTHRLGPYYACDCGWEWERNKR